MSNDQNNQKIPKVSINIVTWNSLKYLPECFKSIFNQTFKDFSVLAIDNDSADKTVDFVRKEYPSVRIVNNSRNLGFAQAHNQGISFSQGEYVLITNPDIILTPRCIEEMVKVMDGDERIGSVGGKLLKMKAENVDSPYVCGVKTSLIDSAGLQIFKSRQIIDRGQGESDNGRYDKQGEVFGLSGALVLYRRQALEDIKIAGDYFDKDFFAYKEDADLAWRLKLRGWKAIYAPQALAYHYRGVGVGENIRIKEIMEKRKGRPRLIKYYSYKNHLTLLAKNEFFKNFFKDFPHIFWYESKKFIYLLFFEPATLRGLIDFLRDWPKTRKKRKAIMANAKVKPEEMRKWIIHE